MQNQKPDYDKILEEEFCSPRGNASKEGGSEAGSGRGG